MPPSTIKSISKISDGTTEFEIKDAQARADIEILKSSGGSGGSPLYCHNITFSGGSYETPDELYYHAVLRIYNRDPNEITGIYEISNELIFTHFDFIKQGDGNNYMIPLKISYNPMSGKLSVSVVANVIDPNNMQHIEITSIVLNGEFYDDVTEV